MFPIVQGKKVFVREVLGKGFNHLPLLLSPSASFHLSFENHDLTCDPDRSFPLFIGFVSPPSVPHSPFRVSLRTRVLRKPYGSPDLPPFTSVRLFLFCSLSLRLSSRLLQCFQAVILYLTLPLSVSPRFFGSVACDYCLSVFLSVCRSFRSFPRVRSLTVPLLCQQDPTWVSY